MIEVQDVTFAYPGNSVPALAGINLCVEPGEFLAITGRNGSGKSTLARLLNGLLRPKAGRVLVDGLDTADEASLVDIRRRAGIVFQDPDNQLVAATVEDDVAFGPENLGLPPAVIRQRVAASLAMVEIEALKDRPPHLLSGGQKQRLALAGILAMEPQYLILDEATAMLDPVAREEILGRVLELRRARGLAVILITHLMEEAVLAERMLVLSAGRVVLAGPPPAVMLQGERLAAVGLKVPVTVALGHILRRAGLQLPAGPVTAEELAEALWKLVSQK